MPPWSSTFPPPLGGVVLLAAVVLGLSAGVVVVDSACQFPSFVQTNRTSSKRPAGVPEDRRDWIGRIRDQFTEVGVSVDVQANVIRTTSTDPGVRSHTRICLQVVHGDKYLVAHEQPGQQGQRYSCLQFVQRSVDVVQIRSAPVGDRMDRAMCRDQLLQTDRWLLVDRSRLGRHRVACPLSGGFSMNVFDKSRNEGVCDAYRGQTRLEADCERGDGVMFLFRSPRCVPQDVYMHSRQPTLCVAGWTDGRYRFTVLRHDEHQHAYFWLLRTPDQVNGPSTGFSAVLFKDLVADTSSVANETRSYIRLDLISDETRPVAVADVSSSLCVDDYEICTDRESDVARRCRPVGGAGWNELALNCPRTCGFCGDPDASAAVWWPTTCSMPADWTGRWTDGATGAAVAVNETATSTPGGVAMSCIRWERAPTDDGTPVGGGSAEAGDVMLVAGYGGGCRPRYRCARALRRTPSLLYLQVSESATWPFVRSPRDPVDCRAFSFDRWTVEPGVAGASRSGFFMALVNPAEADDGGGVECGLPANLDEYSGTLANASVGDCFASLAAVDGGRSIRLTTSGCAAEQQHRRRAGSSSTTLLTSGSYRCLDSTRNPSTGELLIVTRRDDAVSCWLFSRHQPTPYAFYLLVGAQCHPAIVGRTQAARPDHLAFTAAFTRSSSRPVSTRSTTTTTTAVPTTATPSTTTSHPAVPTRRPLSSSFFVASTPPPPSPSPSTSTPPPPSPSTRRMGMSTVDEAVVDVDSERPRTQNSTMANADDADDQSVIVKGFSLGVVAVILAVVQAVIFCRCG